MYHAIGSQYIGRGYARIVDADFAAVKSDLIVFMMLSVG
jgi:hypothetical protein